MKDWTDKKLIDMTNSYHGTIHGPNKCYGCKDLVMLDIMVKELTERGYDVEVVEEIFIEKTEE